MVFSSSLPCRLGLSLVLCLLLWGCSQTAKSTAPDHPSTTPSEETETILRASIAWFDQAIEQVDAMVPAAEQAAQRIIDGGNLYVVGNPGFCEELFVRAGGFPFTAHWTHKEGPGRKRFHNNDVVLFGQFRPNDDGPPPPRVIGGVARGKSQLVWFAGADWPQTQRERDNLPKDGWARNITIVDTHVPMGNSLLHDSLGQMAASALAWALQGEMISAATRSGHTLATYASDAEPGGRDWDATVRGRRLHPSIQLEPIPAGQIGKAYLRICRDQLNKFLATQPENVRAAARRMADCMNQGGMVWAISAGHIHTDGSKVPAGLPIKNHGRNYDWGRYARRMPEGDLLLYMAYLSYPDSYVSRARERGCESVIVSCQAGPQAEDVSQIRSCWKNYDTVIDLPGYPIRVLPTSGVVQTPQWYALMAETARIYEQPTDPDAIGKFPPAP